MAKKPKLESLISRLAEEAPRPADRAPYWDFFFRDQRSPFIRAQLVTAMMAGKSLEVERLPVGALLDAVLLASAARCYHEAEVVDDFNALLRRTDEAWKAPGWTCKVFDQTHMNAADFIIRGTTEFTALEDSYIPDLVGWLLEHDPPEYFKMELTA
jgi:hypothetical protein